MLKVGMFTSGYQRNPLEHCFMDAKEYGYDYIELWGGRRGDQDSASAGFGGLDAAGSVCGEHVIAQGGGAAGVGHGADARELYQGQAVPDRQHRADEGFAVPGGSGGMVCGNLGENAFGEAFGGLEGDIAGAITIQTDVHGKIPPFNSGWTVPGGTDGLQSRGQKREPDRTADPPAAGREPASGGTPPSAGPGCG